jgi:hypothetical protein
MTPFVQTTTVESSQKTEPQLSNYFGGRMEQSTASGLQRPDRSTAEGADATTKAQKLIKSFKKRARSSDK